jgi:hypothetical protein
MEILDLSSRKNKFIVGLVGLALIFFVAVLVNDVLAQGNSNNAGLGEEEGGGGGGEGSGGEDYEDGELCGFAWGAEGSSVSSGSKNGVGWVSFNSRDCDVDGDGAFNDGVPGCPASGTVHDYGVIVDSNRYLVGEAWSSNLGWLKFGGNLSGMPGGGNQQARVRDNGGNSPLIGWARFCAGTDNGSAPGDCSSMTSRTDGWDGWVSLSGSATNGSAYEVTYIAGSEDKFSGYSWGGPVVGYLKWDQSDGSGVRYCENDTLVAGLTATPSSGTVAQLSDVTLTATPADADSYRFECEAGAGYSPVQTSNIFQGCDGVYDTPGTPYTARVEVISGSDTAVAYETITTSGTNNGGSGSLGLSCAMPEPPALSNSRLLVNNPGTWTAQINPAPATGATSGSYVYTFSFDDDGDGERDDYSVDVATTQLTASLDRAHRTVGRKSVVVTVRDTSDPPATGQCSPIEYTVVVNPTIIEI